MTIHLYLSLIPEALIASMLSPAEFGSYYAVGTHNKLKGQAMFLEIDPDFRHDFFPIQEGIDRCVPHEDGRLKRSVYISAYRVLEHIDLDKIKKLYLVSSYGEVLGIDPQEAKPIDKAPTRYLYQEIAPVNPLVVSYLNPYDFYKSTTKEPSKFIKFPAIAFVDLDLGDLADDPDRGAVRDLPYSHMDHLRECLMQLDAKSVKSKMVDRLAAPEFPYRVISSGTYIGNEKKLLVFPMPSRQELREKYYRWWRSANR